MADSIQGAGTCDVIRWRNCDLHIRDVGIGLMTVFNIGILYLMGGEALKELAGYEASKKKEKR